MTLILLLFGGLLFGSFINMLVWRIPNNLTLKGRSLCTHCKHILRWFDLIPVVSFLLLSSRCRFCAQKISWSYPLIEILTAVLFVFAWYQRPQFFSSAINVSLIIFTITALITLFIIDFKNQIVPDIITLPAIVVVLLLQIARGVPIVSYISAALIAGGFFAVQYIFSKGRWIGDGDIRLSVLMGVILGFPSIMVALFLAYGVGACVGVLLIGLGRANLTSKTPFGTYLTLSTFITLLYGTQIIDWYTRLWIKL